MGIHLPAGVNLGGRAGVQLGRRVGASGPPKAGLILWLSGSSIAGLADNASLVAGNLVDSSPAGNTPTAVSGVTKVTGVNSKPAYHFNGAGTITLPAGVSIATQNYSIYVVARCGSNIAFNATFNQFAFVGLGTGNENLFWCQPMSHALLAFDGSNINGDFGLALNCGFGLHGYRSGASNIKFRINNKQITVGSSFTSRALTNGKIGDRITGGFPFSGDFDDVLIYDHTLTDLEETALMTFAGVVPSPKQFICYGDSITAGVLNTQYSLLTSWPLYLQQFILADQIMNFGVTGATMQGQAADVASQFTHFIDNTTFPTANIVGVLSGSNDLAAGRTAAQLIADITACASAVNGIGARAVFQTILSRVDYDVTMEANRQTVNSWYRANAVAQNYVLSDIDANSACGGVGTYANLAVFNADGVHPNAAGNQSIASVYQPVINSII